MRVAAVLVTHNRPQLLLQALAALRAQTRPLDAIYIVDNGSEPPCMPGDIAGTGGIGGGGLESGGGAPSGQDTVTLLRSKVNLGGAGGFAMGMAHAFAAGHDWIWLLDDDAMARPDALARLLDALDALDGRGDRAAAGAGASTNAAIGMASSAGREQVPDTVPVAGVSAAADNPIGALCGTVREFGDIALRHRRRYHLPTAIEMALPRAAYEGAPCRVDTASFVGFLVSASAIAEVGMPERGFFLGYDDTEYALRLQRAGRAVWLVPGSVVEHLRARRARLRAGPFGPKHYFTIRNRIAVARAYATLPVVPTAAALAFGLALWLVSGGPLRRGALSILLHAIGDGVRGRLGPFPQALARHRVQAASTGQLASPANTGPRESPVGTGPPQGSTGSSPGLA
jgi:rhamnopyranosyl-N-acetylglucosaminyl-diphospho-decaprenol beta-1,3/1,4-galactofuranosyltransferase